MTEARRARLEQLIHSTGWTEDKQQKWLIKHAGIKHWCDASDATVDKAIEMLTVFDKMFTDTCVDTSIASSNNDEELEALKVYKDD